MSWQTYIVQNRNDLDYEMPVNAELFSLDIFRVMFSR